MKLTVDDIKVNYGGDNILKEVSLCVQNREFVGLIGPNGSGKSTLLKCIYRVLKPDFGTVRIDNQEVNKMSYKQSARKMAVVAQHNQYPFDFSVQEIVLMGRSPYKKALESDQKKDYEIVEEALEAVGMKSMIHRKFSTLSGGEQQRVIVARALAQQAECLILDEPTNHLDITYQLQLMKIVKNLDITTIAAIHDLNIAAMFCDKIYALKDGTIIAKGTPRDVLTPKLIGELYGVECEVVEDKKKRMHLLFLE